MKNALGTHIEPYTSVAVTSLKEGAALFESLLSANSCGFRPRKIDKPVIIYGAGNLGKMAMDFFDHLKVPVLYVIDINAINYKNDEYWHGSSIIHPDEANLVDKKNSLLVICIVTIPLIALLNELTADGWEDIAFFYDVSEAYCEYHPISNGWYIGKLSKRGKEAIEKVYSSLSDDESRMHYIQFLLWRCLRVELIFTGIGINEKNRFFIPEVTSVLNEQEVFVDCGTHKGVIIEKFTEIVNNKYKDIYIIEPDKESFELCKSTFKDIKKNNMIESALSDRVGEGKFYQGFGFVSKLNISGNAIVRIVTLDSLHIPATFIKMHLEGEELAALKGAAATIKKHRPIVVATIYHNPDGAWKIPYHLMAITRKYRYYMRMHSWGGTGAVFYAIPNERGTKDEAC